MEKAFYSSISQRIMESSRLPYVIAVVFVILGVFEMGLIYVLHAELTAARESIHTRDWQVTVASEEKGMADLHLWLLEIKDPDYNAARVGIAWNGTLHQGLVAAQGLPEPTGGRDYQLWVLDPGELAPVNAGVLKAGRGSEGFAVHPVTTPKVGFAVTLEPAGGSPEPTSSILFAVAPGQ